MTSQPLADPEGLPAQAWIAGELERHPFDFEPGPPIARIDLDLFAEETIEYRCDDGIACNFTFSTVTCDCATTLSTIFCYSTSDAGCGGDSC